MGPLVRSSPTEGARKSDVHLSANAQSILDASLAPSSKRLYSQVWVRFRKFCIQNNFSFQLPLDSVLVINYLADLFCLGLSPSTLASHLSALSYSHKIQNLDDPSSSFLVKKFLKGAQNLKNHADGRLPITKNILQSIIKALPSVYPKRLERILLEALFTLAFHAFLRMGEICLQTGADPSHLLHRSDVKLVSAGNTERLEISFRHFKHKSGQKPITLLLSSDKEGILIKCMHHYSRCVPGSEGPLFQWPNGKRSLTTLYRRP